MTGMDRVSAPLCTPKCDFHKLNHFFEFITTLSYQCMCCAAMKKTSCCAAIKETCGGNYRKFVALACFVHTETASASATRAALSR